MRQIVALGLLLTLVGCSGTPRGLEAPGPKVGVVLAQLPPLTPVTGTTDPIESADAATAYRRVDGALPDASDNRTIEPRLADLGRHIGADADPQRGAAAYKDAIARYKALLADPHGDARRLSTRRPRTSG